jgi:hypothetical protein
MAKKGASKSGKGTLSISTLSPSAIEVCKHKLQHSPSISRVALLSS